MYFQLMFKDQVDNIVRENKIDYVQKTCQDSEDLT